jgi:hypothetical protein
MERASARAQSAFGGHATSDVCGEGASTSLHDNRDSRQPFRAPIFHSKHLADESTQLEHAPLGCLSPNGKPTRNP